MIKLGIFGCCEIKKKLPDWIKVIPNDEIGHFYSFPNKEKLPNWIKAVQKDVTLCLHYLHGLKASQGRN